MNDQTVYPADAVDKYLAQARTIDLSNCPPDFSEAYLRHLGAWDLMEIQLRLQPQSALGWVWKGIVDGLDSAQNHDHSEQMRTRPEAISSTWTDVLAAANKHHAKPPV